MASYRTISAYGANPNAAVNVNADHGWGGYQYPAGVPAALLGTARYKTVSSIVRKELVTLFSLAYQIAADKHGYTIYTSDPNGSGEAWGPWGYENRTISGSSTASNHSKGKANDWNAPLNPYSSSNWQSNFPPAMVADLESIGLCWGGRYGDTMHWEYGYWPSDVAAHEAKARALLVGTGTLLATKTTTTTTTTVAVAVSATPTEEEDDMPYTPEQLVQFAASGTARALQHEAVIDFEGQQLTLERVLKILTDRIYAIQQKVGA